MGNKRKPILICSICSIKYYIIRYNCVSVIVLIVCPFDGFYHAPIGELGCEFHRFPCIHICIAIFPTIGGFNIVICGFISYFSIGIQNFFNICKSIFSNIHPKSACFRQPFIPRLQGFGNSFPLPNTKAY